MGHSLRSLWLVNKERYKLSVGEHYSNSTAMTFRWYLLKRLAWTIVVVWLVLSSTFVLFAYTPDPNEALIKFAQLDPSESPEETVREQKEAIAAYQQARNYDEPVLQRYTRWVVGYATGNWGISTSRTVGSVERGAKPVTAIIADRGLVTLTYLLPAILVATVVGVALGLFAATHRGGPVDYLGVTVAYAGYGVPVFFLALALAGLSVNQFGLVTLAEVDERYGIYSSHNVDVFVIPFLVMTANLLAVQARYARAESLEHLRAEFVKTLRASGASGWAIARHALRNAAIPLVSLFFTEVLTVLFVSIYVLEVALDLPGLGFVAYGAIQNRDIALILGTTLVPVFVGVFGNLLQDIAYMILDPRVDYD
jgi:peptide/nickel transport system permease protein